MKKTRMLSLLIAASLSLTPLCSITASAEDASYSFNISFVDEESEEYVANVDAKLIQRAIEWTDEEHYSYVGDEKTVYEWNSSENNPLITSILTDNWQNFVYSVVVDNLPDGYIYNSGKSVEHGISGYLDGEVKVTIKLSEGEVQENTTPLEGTYSLKLNVMDIVRNVKIAGLDCELFNLQSGEVIASWNTSETEEMYVENLQYSFDKPDSYNGNITYAIRITNLPENYRFFYGKTRDQYGISGFSLEEFANGTDISCTVYLEDTSEDAPKYTYTTTPQENTSTTTTTTTTVNSIKGDANCDNQVDLSDSVMIMQALANPNKYGIDGTADHHLTEQGKLNGDMDGDGLTVGDAQAIQRQLLGLSSNIEFHSSADYLCAIKINGTVFWQTDEGFSEDFSNYTINKVTAYSENGTPQNDGESNFDRKCNTEFIILDEKTIVVKLQEGKVGFWIFRAKDDKTSVLPKIKLYHSVSTTDAQYTEMEKGEVVSIETDYNPLMSDWSGIGILLEFESKDYPITLSTNEGHFTTWDKEEGSGIVTNVGQTYDIGNSGYIFWTPDDLSYSEDYESEIMITGDNNGKSIEVGKIVINMNNKHTLSAVLK